MVGLKNDLTPPTIHILVRQQAADDQDMVWQKKALALNAKPNTRLRKLLKQQRRRYGRARKGRQKKAPIPILYRFRGMVKEA